ncbi:MAG TPA: hypothetical protein ENK07_06175 [Bacteroidetes bacterium]|nr:hypothetical protein [Bacteroidota bacterium]
MATKGSVKMAETTGTGFSAGAFRHREAERPASRPVKPGQPVRLAEVVVFSPDVSSLDHFLRGLCGRVDFDLSGLLLARLELGSERAFQLYGLPVENSPEALVPDLLVARALGALLLYPWDVPFLRERAETVADWYGENYDAPLVVLAFSSRGNPLPEETFASGISLGPGARVVGVDLDAPESLRRALVVLVDMALERVAV